MSCDIKLANAVQEAKTLGIDVLALQEVRRRGDDEFTFDSKGIEGWQFVWSGYKRKLEAGVAFILAPHVKLIGSHFHYNARILSVRVIIHGLCLSLTCCYAPTDTSSESSKTIFYRELRKANEEMLKFNRFKSIFLGDFNATIGMDVKFRQPLRGSFRFQRRRKTLLRPFYCSKRHSTPLVISIMIS